MIIVENGLPIPVFDNEVKTVNGKRPLCYRRRVEMGQGLGTLRTCEIFVFEQQIVWRFDSGETVATDSFVNGHEWFYPIAVEPWEQHLTLPPVKEKANAYVLAAG